MYRKELSSLVKRLKTDVGSMIIPILRALEPEFVNDAYAISLQEVFENLRRRFVNVDTNARIVARSFVGNNNNINKKRFYSSVESAIGINLQNIIQGENLEDILVASTRENVSLIRSIPEEYFKTIESIVFTGTTQGNTAGSMIRQIQKAGGVTTRRAKLIARDQNSKLNSALTQHRSQNLGVTEYIWRTAEDGRVRTSHRRNNGRVFKWNKPPKETGHPGNDVQCRCVAQPIINV